jgi:hypothetical protein
MLVSGPILAFAGCSDPDQAAKADIEGAPHSPAYCRHFLPSRSTAAERPKQAQRQWFITTVSRTACVVACRELTKKKGSKID